MLAVYFAQKAFVLSDGSLLAVRRNANDSHHPLRWEVPGGRLEAGEDVDQHLGREVLEETGITITPGEPFFIWKWNIRQQTPDAPDTIVAVARICSAVTTELSSSGRVDGDNLDLMEWIPLSKVCDYDWIPNMLPVLSAFLAKSKASCEKGSSDRK
jgi:8-oxo-dGTP pyrophosphatase MutT (NUDIX family)